MIVEIWIDCRHEQASPQPGQIDRRLCPHVVGHGHRAAVADRSPVVERRIRRAWWSATSPPNCGIANSTLSHHLDKLKNEGLVKVRREGTFLWYSVDTRALQGLMQFLYAECCTRNQAIEPQKIVCCS